MISEGLYDFATEMENAYYQGMTNYIDHIIE